MLVLSRGRNDKIVFPHLGITVEILHIASNKVRVGVDAPPDVAILRHELKADPGQEVATPPASAGSRKLNHELRNRLHSATLALHLCQKYLQMGNLESADRMLHRGLSEFAGLEELVASPGQPAPTADLRHALIVDDNANEGELLATVLRMHGFRADTAQDGCDALRYLESGSRPDAILLDMRMPRCDGPSTISAIRSNPDLRDLKVFAVTGASLESVELQRGAASIDGWFQKPVNPENLVRELRRQLAECPVGRV